MKKILTVLYILFGVVFLVYLSLPRPGFPAQPPDTLKSNEPADSEDPLRPSYFTDLDREGVLSYFQNEFTKSSLGVALPTYRLNYPPEEAQGIIRDRTRSSYLEEIVHPFRESLFVNGFEASHQKDTIIIEDRLWREKVTLKYFPSNMSVRVVIGFVTLIVFWLILSEWGVFVKKLFNIKI